MEDRITKSDIVRNQKVFSMEVLKEIFQHKEVCTIVTHLNYYICFSKIIRKCIYNTNNRML